MSVAPRVVPPVAETVVPVLGGGVFPVRRIYCIGRNYVEHIRETEEADERDPPFFFQKPRDASGGYRNDLPLADNQMLSQLVMPTADCMYLKSTVPGHARENQRS